MITSHEWSSSVSVTHKTLEEFFTLASGHCLNQVSNIWSGWNGEATSHWLVPEYKFGYPLFYVFFPLLVKELNLSLFNSPLLVSFAQIKILLRCDLKYFKGWEEVILLPYSLSLNFSLMTIQVAKTGNRFLLSLSSVF